MLAHSINTLYFCVNRLAKLKTDFEIDATIAAERLICYK